MGTGRWRGRLGKEITERRWPRASCEPIAERRLNWGAAALQIPVGAFRSTEQRKRDERREAEKEGGGGRERAIAEQGHNELIINMTYVYIMQHSYMRR